MLANLCVQCEKNDGLLLCSKCGTPYCSKKCQNRHWKKHKEQCGKIVDKPIELVKQVELAMGLKRELEYNGIDRSNVDKLLEGMFEQCTENIRTMSSGYSSGPWNPDYSEYTGKSLCTFRDVCQEQKNGLNVEYAKYQREIASLKVQRDAITAQKTYAERELQKGSSESPLLLEIDENLKKINIELKRIKDLSKLNSNTNHSFAILLHKLHAIPKCLICGTDTDPPNTVKMCECNGAKYCSQDCQTADWDTHKMTCATYKA
uniref:MYND-type domain-containing protein n=1 Tax=viral metagenome TaxID=1070528 RepID=A0A6C0I105_9ZZZZ